MPNSSEPLLSKADAARASNVPPKRQQDYIDAGLVSPAVAGGKGRGCGHLFTASQVVGLGAYEQVRRSARGCAPSYLMLTVEGFARLTLGELERHAADGRTHFLFVAVDREGGPRVELGPGTSPDHVDLRPLLRAVKAALRPGTAADVAGDAAGAAAAVAQDGPRSCLAPGQITSL